MSPLLKKIITLAAVLVFVVYTFSPSSIRAATLTNDTAILSNKEQLATATYTIQFTTTTSSNLERIGFQFGTTLGGSTKPASLDLTSATLGTVTGIGSGWTLDTSSASSGYLFIDNGSPTPISAATDVSIVLHSITNPAFNDCSPISGTLIDECYIGITTYSDAGINSVDNSNTPFEFIEDPSLTFAIDSVVAGSTNNGITSTLDTTDTSISFGYVQPGSVSYATHKLIITTNAPHGYTVSAYLQTYMTGEYTGSLISPFGATGATWSTPVAWSTPTGTTPGSNTGWLGANTSDTNVSGWSSGSAKFGPITILPEVVATSTSSAISGDTVYVTYALEINSQQPADTYQGDIIYNVQANY